MIYAKWKRKYNGGFIFIKIIRTLTQQKLYYSNSVAMFPVQYAKKNTQPQWRY